MNQGKLAGAIAQSGTMLAYQMERLPPRRVQVEPYAKEKCKQGCISCVTCSYPELTEDHVLTSAYFKIFRTVTRNAVNKSV